MSDRVYVDATYKSLNKLDEELCGDRVEIHQGKDYAIVVLSDGLGSGVKANILATLTSKIISTMIQNGASLEDTVDTIVHTLPVCKVRGVAYSTFGILRIGYDRQAYLVEFDCPGCIMVRGNQLVPIEYTTREIAGKVIREARFTVEVGDVLALMSDGVVYAGIGELLNLGWDWDNVAKYMAEHASSVSTSARITSMLSRACDDLYDHKPGDDTTVATVKIIPQKVVSLFSGPPVDPADDVRLVHDFMASEGLKIVCGGSSANLVARELHREITTELDYENPDVPPIAKIKGIDLVTEGVLTLRKTVEIIRAYLVNPTEKINIDLIDENHGAAMIAKILMEDCTHLHLFIGNAINPAHQNPNLPVDLSIKLHILEELYKLMKQAGKVVTRKFY